MKRIAKLRTLEDGRELMGLHLDCEVKTIGEHEIEIIGSTGDMDRDEEVIDAKGWDLKNFKKNPVVLPSHDYRQPAIGRATNVKLTDGKLMFKIEFPPEGDYPLADVFRKLYKGGFMKASSVGFIPTEWIDGDGKKNPYRTYTKQELLEISLVTVPSNPNALVTSRGVEKAVQKGVLNAGDVKELMFYVRDLMKKDGDENGDDNKNPLGGDGQASNSEQSKPEEGSGTADNGEAGDPASQGSATGAGTSGEGTSAEAQAGKTDEQGDSGKPAGVADPEATDDKKIIADLEGRVKILEDNIGELLKQLNEAINPKEYWDVPIHDDSHNESLKSIVETAREAFE